ncbi:MAG TPA: hypothetical protein PKA56_05835 [Solirubrobacterales bacterium]|jgi:hypothetical protein|nr:hypothetical protein [Solirubrobacterales bacterium]HMU26705.1 hypothetical protein [Solirubrobacterales bacterium]HMX71257.1 hypothetical protein [Solirubrobacterales bacterium]HMY24700.1 hypothetical protein [Solirubrobacterales bacterium]HNA23028.1 hypothetical protein [Solirubrobacterales bacterium]
MEIKTVFLIFGISLACFAVIITFIGLRSKNFPSKGALIGLLLLAAFLVGGTTTFAVKLSIEEQHEREEGQKGIGEETTDAAAINIIRQDQA